MQENRENDHFNVISEKTAEGEDNCTPNKTTDNESDEKSSVSLNSDDTASLEENQKTNSELSDIENEEIYPDSLEDAEEDHFLFPETATFFATEPQETENEIDSCKSENELLDIEHFSDYKSKTGEGSPSNEDDNLAIGNEYSQEGYESITILDDPEQMEYESPLQNQKSENPDTEIYNPEKPRKVDARFDFLELFIFTLLTVILLTSFVFRHSVVEGHSMQNTLQDGEHLIISDLFYRPKKGDIIVCQDRATGHDNAIVKRIIATEGDTIEILPDGSVFVNDRLLIEEYVFLDGTDFFSGLEKTTVPDDMIFVMGDHRNNSSDSRTFDSTFVREDAILGKVVLRFYPFSKFGTVK